MDESQGGWDRLAIVNMAMHRRIVEYLNSAIGAVNLAAQSNASAQMVWRQHSIRQIMRAHNTFTAWSSLFRYKAGETPIIPSDERVFRYGDYLDWLSAELLQKREPHPYDELNLLGGRETLQEALILLYSCAFGLGPGIRLVNEASDKGVRLGVRYRKHGNGRVPPTLDALLSRPTDNWRLEHLTFELECARDFLAMNGCELVYEVEKKYCTLTFFVPAVQVDWSRRVKMSRLAEPPSDVETLYTEEGLRRSLIVSEEDDDDLDATQDGEVPTQT